MHNTTKEVVADEKVAKELGVDQGTHILSTTCEADGPFEMVSPKGKLHAEIIALRRTESGGVFLQTALSIEEPQPEVPKAPEPVEAPPTPEELAAAYLKEKGMKPGEAKAAIERYGAAKILQEKNAERDAELKALLGNSKPASDQK